MNRRIVALATAGAGLALVPAAQAHVTVHPNVIPEGAFAVLDIRVPNETDDADTTKVRVQMPAGFEFVSADPPPGWRFTAKRSGKEVSEVTFSGGRIPPGQFREFPLSVGVPGKSGDVLTFKALQTYSDGEVVRWIGPPDAEKPASTITISDAGGLIQDSTGDGGHADTAAHGEPEAAPATRVVEKQSSDGLAVAALIVGGLGLAAGGAALATRRRT